MSDTIDAQIQTNPTAASLRSRRSRVSNSSTTTSPEERKLVRKLDWLIPPWIAILYFLSVEDRANVGFAMTMNQEAGHDLATVAHLSARENNIGLGLFYVAYIIFEVPSNLVMTKLNPSLWISRIMISWGIVVACMAAISQPWHFYLLRFLLGVCEAGAWPGFAYYMTLWYRPNEVSSRLGITYLAGPVSGAVGGLISAGIQLIDTKGNLYGWQWLFLISGIVSIIFGICNFWVLPDKPESTKRFLKGDEKKLAIERLKTSHEQEKSETKASPPQYWKGLCDRLKDGKTWLFVILYLSPVMAATSLGYFIPKIVQQIGTYNSIQVSLMSIPPYVFGGFSVYVVTTISDRTSVRGWFIISCCILSFAGFAILSFAPSVGARYFGLMVVAGATYPTVPLTMAWTANSNEGDVAVASATGIVSSIANFGALICTFALYTGWPSDAPRYIGSNMVNGSAMLLAAGSAVVLRWWLQRLNNKSSSDNESSRSKVYLL
ncbi:hypothetical protein NQZ79_g2132 [Umbelopsis isabellina]|nr:hypothetical protein NQZ79_g2132 [Umbelopsis isabellina]